MGLLDKLFGPPSKDVFAKLVANAIRQAGETRTLLYDKEPFRLVSQDKGDNIQYLQNGYEEYIAAAAERRDQVVQFWAGQWFASQKELPEEFEDASHDLLPALRSRWYYEAIRLEMAVEGRELATHPHEIMADHFAVGLVYDLPHSMHVICQDDLDSWGVSFYEALEVAKRNLPHLEHTFVHPGECERLYAAATNDSYDSTRLLLLPDLIHDLHLKGDPIATVPHRDSLLVAGEDDVEALRILAEMTAEEVQHSRMISGVPLRFDGADWHVWLPDRDHPLYVGFKNLHTRSLGHEFTEQKELLDKLHERNSVDIFVASFSGYQNKDSDLLNSYCVWAAGVRSWLPCTDRIAFVQGKDEPVIVDWHRAMETVGPLMKPTDTYPQRFEVSDFPTAQQLAAMTEP